MTGQTPYIEARHNFGFLVSEANGHRSREQITVSGGAKVSAGMVLGQKTLGAAVAAAVGGNTGNGFMGAVTVGGAAKVGVYTLRVTKAAANAGDFEVFDPTGEVTGLGSVGTAFNAGGISFTLADGSADFVVGDSFTITVAAGSGVYVPYNPGNTDGSQIPAGILGNAVDATLADVPGAAVVRSCEVNKNELIWDASVNTQPKIDAACVVLKNIGIIVRT